MKYTTDTYQLSASSPSVIPNKIGDLIWYFTDPVRGNNITITWTNYIGGKWANTLENIEWSQRLISVKYPVDSSGICFARRGIKGEIYALARMWRAVNKIEGLKRKPIETWSSQDVANILLFCVKKEDIGGSDPFPGLYNHGTIEHIVTNLRQANTHYEEGKLVSGPQFFVPEGFVLQAVSGYINSLGYNPSEWIKGKSWLSVPIEIAMLQLADAIELIRSDKTKALLAYFEFSRENPELTDWIMFRSNTYHKLNEVNFDKSEHQKKYGRPSVRKENIDLCKRLNLFIKEKAPSCAKQFPFITQREVFDYCNLIRDAAIVSLLILTGIRTSELTSIKADWFFIDDDNAWVFKSRIVKTDYGLITIRGFSGLAAEFCDVLCGLSYVDKKKYGYKLLSKTWTFTCRPESEAALRPDNYNLKVVESSIRSSVTRYYNYIVEKYGDQIKKHHPYAHPHQYRHTFAEFALRRFDGNVLEEIRSHYRHAWGSYMVRRYTNNKLREEERNQLEQDYIAELASRMALGNMDEFSGPVAVYIKNHVERKYTSKTPEEIERNLAKIVSGLESVVPHEWGYCIVDTKRKNKAACYNSDMDRIESDTGASIDNCSVCCHRLTHCSQKENIIRIGLAHQNFIDKYPLPVMKDKSEKTVDACGRLLNEISLNNGANVSQCKTIEV
tara:strand:+ start:4117 stop:6129 length:2013 start_codon:yes stop_codon:yes gene_type:complete